MSDKNSNRLSLIIAIIAIVLILGGVYLLNRSFSTPTKTATATTNKPSTRSTTSNSAKKTSTTTSANTSVTAKSDNESSTNINKDTVTKESTPLSTPSGSDKEINPTTQNPVTPSTETKKPEPTTQPLAENEIIAKYLGPNSAGQARFEIQECGKKGSTSCLNPNKFSINNSSKYDVTLTEGVNYKFVAKYTEDTNFILFESIDSITEIK